MNSRTVFVVYAGLILGCHGSSGSPGPASGGAPTTGGVTVTGGSPVPGGVVTVTGGSPASGGVAVTGGSSAPGGTVAATTALIDRLAVKDVTLPQGVKPGRSNWRIWTSSSLNISPVYIAPLATCGSLVCFTTGTADTRTTPGTSHAYVARLDANDSLSTIYDLGTYECRGLAAEPDGHFGALLWAAGTTKDCVDPATSGRIYVTRFDAAGTPGTPVELTNLTGTDTNCPTDFGIGESRLEFGGTTYGAYYHVHSKAGHEGDTLKYVSTAGVPSTTWPWGCSHSMSNLLRYNPSDKKFMPACVTDCYPGTTGSDFATSSIGGVYLNNRNKVMDVAGGCNGSVAAELGGAAVAPTGWKLVFNAHQNKTILGQSSYSASTMNQDIGFASIAAGLTAGGVTWLTTTTGINEADSGIERWVPAGDPAEQYVVGWSEPGTAYKYKLGRLSPTGTFLEGPVDITAKAKWGRRDDPFRADFNGDIVWAWFDSAGSTTLRIGRLRSGGTASCTVGP